MRLSVAGVAAVALVLCGCSRPTDAPVAGTDHHGRYAGVGVYLAGRMWSQMVAKAPKDPGASRLADDEQVIVVVDSRTGELRECGNLSGYCVGLQPWSPAQAASQTAPVPVAKHADQLDRDAEAETK